MTWVENPKAGLLRSPHFTQPALVIASCLALRWSFDEIYPESMLVLYFLQGELGESMDRPNAFVVRFVFFSQNLFVCLFNND